MHLQFIGAIQYSYGANIFCIQLFALSDCGDLSDAETGTVISTEYHIQETAGVADEQRWPLNERKRQFDWPTFNFYEFLMQNRVT